MTGNSKSKFIRAGIAIAIVLILGAVLWPSYLDDHERSHIAEAKRDLRTLAIALESYYIGHMAYPPAADEDGRWLLFDNRENRISAGYLSTAISEASPEVREHFTDWFHQVEGREQPYRFATNGFSCWILASNGPDEEITVNVAEFPAPEIGGCSWEIFLNQFGVGYAIEYDASNGTESSGDILRVGP
jgi:Tfp pilus assembly protein PilE